VYVEVVFKDRDKTAYQLDIFIWLVDSPTSDIKDTTTRSRYFANVRHIKKAKSYLIAVISDCEIC